MQQDNGKDCTECEPLHSHNATKTGTKVRALWRKDVTLSSQAQPYSDTAITFLEQVMTQLA